MSNDKKVTVGSGNVFADLGFANPEEELLKAKLVREIRAIIKRRKLTQVKAATMLGLKQPYVSSLITGRVGKFSIDRLVRCLDRLDYKVDVVIRHKPRRASFRAVAAEGNDSYDACIYRMAKFSSGESSSKGRGSISPARYGF
jgi:predicted XRE-type DNA-binding protein